MSKGLRQIIFWTHLVIGIAAGLVIAVMCFTATALPISYKWAGDGIYKLTGTQAASAPQQQKTEASSPSTSPTTASIIDRARKEESLAEVLA